MLKGKIKPKLNTNTIKYTKILKTNKQEKTLKIHRKPINQKNSKNTLLNNLQTLLKIHRHLKIIHKKPKLL